jgi:hypothetical protein
LGVGALVGCFSALPLGRGVQSVPFRRSGVAPQFVEGSCRELCGGGATMRICATAEGSRELIVSGLRMIHLLGLGTRRPQARYAKPEPTPRRVGEDRCGTPN